jgi:hypothetical protein
MGRHRIVDPEQRLCKVINTPMTVALHERILREADRRNLAVGTMVREILMREFPEEPKGR